MKVRGKIRLSGDKSISHRALMISSISKGVGRIENLCNSQDVQSTINCLKLCGADICLEGKNYRISSSTLQSPTKILNCGNSGTTIRLLSGLLSGQGIKAKLSGDKSLMSRPMDRIIDPLNIMGADILFDDKIIKLNQSEIKGEKIENKTSSAQVKSSIILAALGGKGKTNLKESYSTRDHTERMLSFHSSQSINVCGKNIEIYPGNFNSENLNIPGDISKASFLMALACLSPDSNLTIEDILVNPQRMGFAKALQKMGSNISISKQKNRHNEPIGDISIKSTGQLKNIRISASDVMDMIDEIPILTIVGAFSSGIMEIEGISELRIKESDRVFAIVSNLKKMGCDIREIDNNILIKGRKYLYNTRIKTFSDHRIAMAFYIASFFSKGKMILDDVDCIKVSFPDFFDRIKEIVQS